MTRRNSFVDLPLQKLLNRQNLVTRVEDLEAKSEANPSARSGQLGQISANTGNLIVDGQLVVTDGDDGQANITIDRDGGITLRNQVGSIIFQSVSGTDFDDVQIYIDGADNIVLQNQVGDKSVVFDMDNAVHSLRSHAINYSGMNLEGPAQYMIDNEPLGYSLRASGDNATPADATTYYIGSLTAMPTTSGRRRVYIPQGGTITRAYLFCNFVAGTNEPSTMYLRLNDTSDTALTTAVDLSTPPFAAAVAVAPLTVATGDFFELKWVTPTWVTNPTAVFWTAQIWIEF